MKLELDYLDVCKSAYLEIENGQTIRLKAEIQLWGDGDFSQYIKNDEIDDEKIGRDILTGKIKIKPLSLVKIDTL